VKVLRGCVVTNKKNSVLPGEIELYSDQASYKTDKKRRNLGGCLLPNGQLGSLSGAAAGGGLSGAEVGAIAGIGGAGAVILGVALSRGGNPSPSR
jgi:hypothetical protein